jgi:hypothetical protein
MLKTPSLGLKNDG